MRAKEFITEMSFARKKKKTLQRLRSSPLKFKGYRCTKDCSGHKAGYYWAKQKGLKSMNQVADYVNNSF
jgi:hypothetical protein